MNAGELVTETLDYDGGRAVTVYLPPAPPDAIVFAGDGQLIAPWGADVERTMVVGTHRLDDEMARLHEYTPVFDAATYAAHEKFFVDDVRAWVRSRFGFAFPRDRTAVCGVSASGELSLSIGLRHPEIYGAVFCASPGGGYQPPGDLSDVVPRVYLVAGTEEPWFRDNAARWVDPLRNAGADVVMFERAGDHGDPFWRAEFARQVRWAFPQ